jgi:hypothetical protein
MELEEMKASWEALSKKVEKQEQLTTQIIENMTQQNFKSKLNNITKWELSGTVICFASAGYVIFNFAKLSQVYLQVFALIGIAILAVLPVISLWLLKGMGNLNVSSKTYSETISAYAHRKIRFQRFQKLSVLFTVVLMITGMPVIMAIRGIDIGKMPHYWSITFPVMLVFLFAFAWRVLRYYDSNLEKAEHILTDMEH